MQAKINITLDLDEIFTFVKDYLLRGSPITDFDNRFKELIDKLANKDTEYSLKLIEQFREFLMKVDTKLNDSYKILLGYSSAVLSQKLEQQQEEENKK